GNIDVGTVDGALRATTGTGQIRVGRATGATTLKNSNGETIVATATHDISVKNANGDITIDRAGGEGSAKTAMGSIRLGAIRQGSIGAHTAAGDITIGIAEGTAAYLDVSTTYGHVDSELEGTGGPPTDGPQAHIRARTSAGDITIRRAHLDPAGD